MDRANESLESPGAERYSRSPDDIAVVGMACLYPGAPSPLHLWENILARRQQFRAFLEQRMPARDYVSADHDAPDLTYGTQGAFVDGFDFDLQAWKVPKSTFVSTDISHWLALTVAARALADAGCADGAGLPRERTGVIVGNSLTGEQTRSNSLRLRWPFVRRVVEAELRDTLPRDQARSLVDAIGERYRSYFPPTTEDTLAGALSNTIAGRICGAFDFGGGGYVVDGACASSLLAVCTAASALVEGRVDVCLAGGVDVSLDPFELVGFAKARALTPTAMRVYDRRGDGFIPGEGCGFVVLRRLADARASHDRVYAVLKGWGISSDGRNAITAPRVSGQARAIATAWTRAGRPDFVEGHGTGTALGDRVELEALAIAAGAADARSIGVTSLKSIVGHTKAAAGIGAFIKAVVAVNRRIVPPTAGCSEPHPVFNDTAASLYPAMRGEIRDPRGMLSAGVSGMGFGGINTHVVVCSADAPDPALASPLAERALLASHQDSELFVLGAANLDELHRQAHALAAVASQIAHAELADLSADLLTRLPPAPAVRAAVLASTPAELAGRLERLAQEESADGPEFWLGTPQGVPRIGFLCPGQGSQQLDAARTLLARDAERAAEIARLADCAQAEGCPDLFAALYPPLDRAVTAEESSGLRAQLDATQVAQPALCLVSLAWARRLADLGIVPAVVGGHSLGELSAFALAGAIEPETLMRLAARRGQAMAAPGERPAGMVSLTIGRAEAEALCAAAPGYAAVANINAPDRIVVSAEAAALDDIVAQARQRGITAQRLAVSNGFHSELVAAAATVLRSSDCIPANPATPRATLLSTMFEPPVTSALDLRAHVADHARRPVDFVSLARRIAARCDLLVEVGPGRVLSPLVDAILGGAGPRSLPVESRPGRAADLNAVLAAAWVRGAPIRWTALHRGRLLRPFIAAAARRFIVNPCEARRESDGDGDAGERAARAPARHAAAPNAARSAAAPAADASEAGTTRQILDDVARMTGFERASLAAEQRLQDDLNLDSIKAGEIVATAARRLGVADRVDPAQFLRSPVSQIARALVMLHAEAGEPGPESIAASPVAAPGPAAAPAAAAPAPDCRWVRTFGLRAVPAPFARGDWSGARVRLLGARCLKDAMEAALVQAGATPDPSGVDVIAVLGATATAQRVAELHGVVSALGANARSLLVVQRLDGRFGLDSAGSKTPGAAFARSLSLERPRLCVRVLDVAEALNDADVVAAVVHAGRAQAAGFTATGLDHDGSRELVALPIAPGAMPLREHPLQAGELVLVTGGARGITAACAEALARATGVRLAVVGSTPRDRADEEMLRALGRLALAGCDARYWRCDLSRPDQVAALVAAIRTAQGPIAALVHGAGRNAPRRAEQVSAEEALLEIAPKLAGGEALLAALEDCPPRLVVALTSIIGVSGMPGNAWYAFANEALDLALAGFGARHRACSVLSIAFGVWSDIGMGARLGSVPVLARMGIGALDPEEGVARFLQLIERDPGTRQPIVTAHLGGMPTWPARWPLRDSLRFLDGEIDGVPGVEARVRTTLHPQRDAWLRDHDFRGSLLLPTVFGLEAMAQAAWLARGGAGECIRAVHDIDLSAPIVVAEGGTAVEVRATVRGDDANLVDCELRTEQSGFARAHFAATIEFAAALSAGPRESLPDLPAADPPIDPARDLYSRLLFQGPAFQRMRTIRGGEAQALRFEGAVQAPSQEQWLLGDPYFRDALLQAGQVLVAQDESLPVRIASIELDDGHAAPGSREVLATIHTSTGKRHIGEVVVATADGRRQQKISGYEVQVLARHPDHPQTIELLRPADSDQRRLRDQLAQASSAAGVPSPEMALATGAFAGLPREARQAIVRRLLDAHAPGASLAWEADGRPVLGDGCGVSIAHDDGALLLVTAGSEVGCDLEAIRPRADWEALLGPARQPVFAQLLASEARHVAGTRIWSAGEALHKSRAASTVPAFVRRSGELVEFAVPGRRVFTFPFVPSRGPRRMIALALAQAAPASADHREALIDPAALSVRLRAGEPDRMEVRFVVSFDESRSLGGRVPAVVLASWMGRLRELGIMGLRSQLLPALASGREGMVTQSAWAELEGDAGALDQIESQTWVEELRPSTCLLRNSYARVADDGTRTPVGHSAQRFGWVDVQGHGQVRAAPFPPFLHEFLAALHRPGAPAAVAPPLLLPAHAPVSTSAFATTLADANVVGNLYYAQYFDWVQRLLDRFVFANASKSLRARGELGELVVLSVRIDYLREAMPFDTIDVALHPAGPGARSEVEFDLVFERREADGAVSRLALGRVTALWCLPGRALLEIPDWLRGATPARSRLAPNHREVINV